MLCFERRFSKQNSVIRLISNILAQKKIFGSTQIFGLAKPLVADIFCAALVDEWRYLKSIELLSHI